MRAFKFFSDATKSTNLFYQKGEKLWDWGETSHRGSKKCWKCLFRGFSWLDGWMMMRLTWGLWRGCGSVAYWGAAAPPQRKGDRSQSPPQQSQLLQQRPTRGQKVQQQQMRLLQNFLRTGWLQKQHLVDWIEWGSDFLVNQVDLEGQLRNVTSDNFCCRIDSQPRQKLLHCAHLAPVVHICSCPLATKSLLALDVAVIWLHYLYY